MRHLFNFVILCFLLAGCHHTEVEKGVSYSFPLKLDLKNYTVVNYIPLRRGVSLDHVLHLEQWASEKVVPSGLQGEGVLGLLEGRASLDPHPTDPSLQRLSVDIIISFEFKNQPFYGKGKAYFRLSETDDLSEKDIPQVYKYIEKKLQALDGRFFSVIESEFPQLKKEPETIK